MTICRITRSSVVFKLFFLASILNLGLDPVLAQGLGAYLNARNIARSAKPRYLFCLPQSHARVASRRLRSFGEQGLGEQRAGRLFGHRPTADDSISRHRVGRTTIRYGSAVVGRTRCLFENNARQCDLQVILGGGRQEFLPKTMNGNREDGRDLIAEWKTRMTKNHRRYGYVKNKTELSQVNVKGVDKLLGD